jgi:two-component system sensor histidine kinase/response regulator
VQASADSLLTIVNDILDFSKIEAGKLALESNDLDLVEVVEGSVELLAEQARAKKLQIGALVEPGVPANLRGDAGRLRQVLTNLIGNAIKFTEAGEILVTAEVGQETAGAAVIRFSVSDTGIGIAPDTASLLFSPFVQADGSTTRRYGGTGLGLAICRQLVELMNGGIGVESRPGEGSTFWFTAEMEKHDAPSRGNPPFEHPARILIVDGHETTRRVLRQQVISLGLRADVAATISEAMESLRRAHAEGDDFAAGIVDAPLATVDVATLGLPLILATLHGRRREDLEKYLAAGFRRTLTKPVRRSNLHDCLAGVLGAGGPGAAQMSVASVPPASQSLRVLVAEDNRVNQRVVLLQLENLGHRAVAVANGLEALTALEEIDYDVVLMDCHMPEMDGYEATARIRAQPRWMDLPIIAMTANAMASDREQCFAAGMNEYIAKPFKVTDLAAVLARVA